MRGGEATRVLYRAHCGTMNRVQGTGQGARQGATNKVIGAVTKWARGAMELGYWPA